MLYILVYFILPIVLLYLIIYTATKHAISNTMIEKEEETIHDPSSHKISLLVELRDLDIIDNHELEKLIGHYEIDYQREESNEKLSEYVSLLKEIRQDQVINLENYDSRVVELQVKLKNKV